MSIHKKIGLMAIWITCAASCKDLSEDSGSDPNVSSTARAQVTKNAPYFNAPYFNAPYFNAPYFNAPYFNGPNANYLNAIVISASNFRGKLLFVKGSELIATDGLRILSGKQLTGALLQFENVDKAGKRNPFTIRIEDASLDPNANATDVWQYRMTKRNDNDPQSVPWTSLCQDEKGANDSAIPLSGRWDEKTGNYVADPKGITFACRDFVIGKCVAIGYRPWAKATACTGTGKKKDCNEVNLADYHQACTRMLRADYCGNGVPYTTTGTLVDVYDYLEPQLNVPETDWDLESRWTETGALCLNEPRHPELLNRWKRPDCDGDGKPDKFKSCSEDPTMKSRGMIVTRVQGMDSSGSGGGH